jgi:antitoxin YefM
MKTTVNIKKAQDTFPALVRTAEKGGLVVVTRQGKPVACLISHRRMSAIAETLDILGNARAMEAITKHKAGLTKFGKLNKIHVSGTTTARKPKTMARKAPPKGLELTDEDAEWMNAPLGPIEPKSARPGDAESQPGTQRCG